MFFVSSVHTMEELKLTGNHLKGSRPILTFSSNFDEEPHWKLLKELIMQVCFFLCINLSVCFVTAPEHIWSVVCLLVEISLSYVNPNLGIYSFYVCVESEHNLSPWCITIVMLMSHICFILFFFKKKKVLGYLFSFKLIPFVTFIFAIPVRWKVI